MLSSLHQHVARLKVAYLVLILSLIPTVVVYFRVRINVENRDRARFDRIVREKQSSVEQRLPRIVDEMLSLRGLFAVNPSVNAEQWRSYVSNAQVSELVPGMRALGYAERVEANQRQDFLRTLRSRAGAEAAIQPAGDRPVYFATTFLNVFDTNTHAQLGHDPYADPERHAIMDEARDSGQPVMTGRFIFTNQSGGKIPGFVVYLPVYRGAATPVTVEQRRAALQGFVFASFDPRKFLAGLTREPDESMVDLEAFDGPEMTAEHLLFDWDQTLHSQQLRPHQLISRASLPVLNRTWTLYFSTEPAFKAESEENLPFFALAAWLVLSLLLFSITAVQVDARNRAESMAVALQKSEAALAAEKERLAVTLYSIGDGVITTDDSGVVLSLNQAAEQLTGW